jgi:hypothetical protein
MTTNLTSEHWFDVVSLAILALVFWNMFRQMVTTTWRWERLGIALTFITAGIAVSYSIAAANIVIVADIYTLPTRIAIRSFLIVNGVVIALILRKGAPPRKPNRMHHDITGRSTR